MGLLIQALAFYLKRINMDLNFVLNPQIRSIDSYNLALYYYERLA